MTRRDLIQACDLVTCSKACGAGLAKTPLLNDEASADEHRTANCKTKSYYLIVRATRR